MSRLEWFILFIAFVAYVLIGGAILYAVESEAEAVKHADLLAERHEIQELVRRELENGSLERTQVLEKLAEYCGKPVMFAPNNTEEQPLKIWNFYNSFFVAVTIVSSIGYGNMAPTTVGTRMFCIVYALIGIPFNGILLAGMGEYFSRTFLRAHHRYKEAPEERSRLSLFLKVLQYLATGIGIFILLPAIVFVYAEEWYYDEAVYYAFVTLSTIGFGDYVAGYMTKYDAWKQSPSALVAYRTFIVLWILFGLGYLAMILSFITRALRSSRIRRLEHRMAKRFKSTHAKLWQNASKDIRYLRRVLNELYMLKFKVRLQNQNQSRLNRLYRAANAAAAANNSKNAAKNATFISIDSDSLAANNNNNSFSPLEQVDILQSLKLARSVGDRDDSDLDWHVQPVYRATRQSLVPTSMRERSNSLPGRLPSQITEEEDTKRRRFDSEGPAMSIALPRTVSESCLDMIDRGATFAAAPKRVDTNELLATVVDALASAGASDEEEEEGGVHGFSDAEILSSEGQPSLRSRASSIAQSLRSVARSRAGSLAHSFRSRSGSVAAGGRTPPDWEDVEAAKRNVVRSKGKESPISLRKALALRSAERDFAEASSGTASPIPRHLLSSLERRCSDGEVMTPTPTRMRASSLAPGLAGLYPLHQLDDTTVGDLLRALHSLHSRVESTPLSEEARVTHSRRASEQDEEAHSRRGSRRGSRLDSSPSSRHLAQQLLDRLENGHVNRDVTSVQRDSTPRDLRNGARAEGRSREVRSGSRDSTNSKRDVTKSQRESSSMSRTEQGRRSRGRKPTSTIVEESSPSQEELPTMDSKTEGKTESDSDSEKSIIISRL